MLRVAQKPEVMDAASDFVARVVRKYAETTNDATTDDNDEATTAKTAKTPNKDVISRITETVLQTEENVARFNAVATNAIESVAIVFAKVFGKEGLGVGMLGGDDVETTTDGGGGGAQKMRVAELVLKEIEKHKKFMFDLVDVTVRAFVAENQKNEANPFKDAMKALESNPRVGFRLIDALATKVVETYVTETHKSGFVSEMAGQSNTRRVPRSAGSIADLPAEEFRASASFAMEKRLSLSEGEKEKKIVLDDATSVKKKTEKRTSPKTPLERAGAAEEEKHDTDKGDIPDQTPNFNGLTTEKSTNATTTAVGMFRTFEGELAKDLFDVVRATPNSRKFAVEIATQCVRSATTAVVFAFFDVFRIEFAKAGFAVRDWISSGAFYSKAIPLRPFVAVFVSIALFYSFGRRLFFWLGGNVNVS